MNNTEKMLEFIEKCPTSLHTVETVKKMLSERGFTELSEKDTEKYTDKAAHFVTRGDSSIIAFKGGKRAESFMVCASHGDTPALKVTGLCERVGAYATVPVEKYGGSILYSWLDRPLSVAGRVVLKTADGIKIKLFNIERDLLSIPSIAIHQNRTVNDGYKFNVAKDMLPLFSLDTEGGRLYELIAKATNASRDDIISADVYVYNREKGRVFGLNDEFILSPRLDNLASVFTSLTAFLDTPERDDTVSVFVAFDNEEVGNSTKQGANSTFLKSVLQKLSGGEDKLLSMLTDSFMVSLDNSHAKHPNHPELSNPAASPILGGGVAVKYHANQFYTTDAVSDGVIRTLARKADVPLQSFATRADMLSGSTLGSVATTRLGIPSVDLGIPELAMHSSSEICSSLDIDHAIKLISMLFSSRLSRSSSEIKII